MKKEVAEVLPLVFGLFNEIGILSQLSLAEFRKALGRDLSTSEFGVLNHFVRVGDGVTPGELARMFQVTKPSMTAIVRKLERKGFVEVKTDAQDRRCKLIKITEKGKSQREKSISSTAPFAERLIDEFGAEKLAAALPYLTSLRIYLDEARNAPDEQSKTD